MALACVPHVSALVNTGTACDGEGPYSRPTGAACTWQRGLLHQDRRTCAREQAGGSIHGSCGQRQCAHALSLQNSERTARSCPAQKCRPACSCLLPAGHHEAPSLQNSKRLGCSCPLLAQQQKACMLMPSLCKTVKSRSYSLCSTKWNRAWPEVLHGIELCQSQVHARRGRAKRGHGYKCVHALRYCLILGRPNQPGDAHSSCK